MSEETQAPPPPPPPPPWVGEHGFIGKAEWLRFDEATRREWQNFAQDVRWLLDQPQFRRFMFTVLNGPRFCGTDMSPVRQSPELTYHAIGIQDAGRALRLVLQTVSPKMWMRTMHDAFNGAKGAKE